MAFRRWYPRVSDETTRGPIEPTRPWDRIKLGGYVLPCHHAVITAGGVELRADKKGGAGQNGSMPAFHGLDPKPLTIDLYFSTVEQANAFARIYAFICPIPGVETQSLDIEAQAIDDMPITAVSVTGCSALLDSAGYKRRTLSCLHWLSSKKNKKKVTSTPTASTTNARSEAAAAKANPRPSTQAKFCAPDFTPGA